MFESKITVWMLAVALFVSSSTVQAQNSIPYMRLQGDTSQLIVDGQPFLMLAGELGNSSSSSLEYMETIWPNIEEQNVNTILAPVYWELLEPEEGVFDFELVDGLIAQARKRDVRLVLLWFGAWKNSMSCYVPGWVKRDSERFPRAKDSEGKALEMLTASSTENRDADMRTFVALMQHLKKVDSRKNTVIMVQVENEIGMIPVARDHCALAEAAYAAQVPEELVTYLKAHRVSLHPRLLAQWESSNFEERGTWTELFGDDIWTEEVFMAWQYATYVEEITAAGKAEFELPMYANAALVRPDYEPGRYPGAGPLPHLIDVWRAGAPSLNFISPDIYFSNFVEWATAYDVPGNPLFIPETSSDSATVANALWAFGERDAMGFSPFSIEDNGDVALGQAYGVLDQLMPLITAHQGLGTMRGFRPPVSFEGKIDSANQSFVLGDYKFEVTFIDPWTQGPQQLSAHGGLVIALDNETFFVAGTGITITFAVADESGDVAGIDTIEEGSFVNGEWQRLRVLNGDQSHQGRHLRLPPGEVGIQKLKLYRYR